MYKKMKKTVIVNIYNFIRMSHIEPSVFIQDDFETVKNQITLIRQYGFPATYALKYDALTDSRYQELLKTYSGKQDEISAWWEITGELCRKASVTFRGAWTEDYDERVDSAYSIGYAPEERRKLVDAYMADFYQVFGFYPKTIGSWVLDTVTISHAAEKYGIVGTAICRDQMGTDGFTLWGGFPNGVYYPSKSNENIPAPKGADQLNVPMFRLLGPDPIYNFEQDVREGLQGVYTLEPSWLIGRNPEWISWFFRCLTKEDSLGVGYAHVGQENNFLWENIKPGMEPQLKELRRLSQEGSLRIETMADSAKWFRETYRLTPPMSFQASADWDKEKNLSAQWYACSNYRIGFLGEEGRLRIRDCFLYPQNYPSRYLNGPMRAAKSLFDAPPLLFPQKWIDSFGQRPFLRLVNENGQEPSGSIRYKALDSLTAQAQLLDPETNRPLATFTMHPDRVLLEGPYDLCFDYLPHIKACHERQILLEHEGFSYGFQVTEGRLLPEILSPTDQPFHAEREGTEKKPDEPKIPETKICRLVIRPEEGRICLKLGESLDAKDIFTNMESAASLDGFLGSAFRQHAAGKTFAVPPMAPEAEPASCIFPAETLGRVQLSSQEHGEIHYTYDGTQPTELSPLYHGPLEFEKDTLLSAKLFLPDGRSSETVSWKYSFGLQGIRLTSGTVFDPRPVFGGNGIEDLLNPKRGSTDYLDGRWRGTLRDLEVCGQLAAPAAVKEITIGFLSHHRSGIIFPESIQLYTGSDMEHLSLTAKIAVPCEPCPREIYIQDFSLPVHKTIGAFRLVAHRYAKMPGWCCYRGSTGVFTMSDNIIVSL